MDRREVMLDQKGEGCSRELCREDWLEQVSVQVQAGGRILAV